MKLSKQERIALLIIMAVIILALGAFLIIKPAIEDYSSTKKTLASKQTELSTLKTRSATKDQLRKDIEQAYDDGEHLADMFFPELASYEADDAFRAFLEQCQANVIVEEITVAEPTTATLSAWFNTSEEVEYALKSYAKSGIDLTEEELEVLARTEALQNALMDEQTIGASEVKFKVTAKNRDEILKFADEVNNYEIMEAETNTRKAIMMSGLEITYDEVNDKYDALVADNIKEMDDEGYAALVAEVGGDAPQLENKDNGDGDKEPSLDAYLFTYEGTITFYSIERMQDPKAQLDAQDGIEAN